MKLAEYRLDIMLFSTFVFLTLAFTAIIGTHMLYPKPMADELMFYKPEVANFTIQHLKDIYNNAQETKPITFLLIEKALNADIPATRLLNFIFICINTYLIYKLTKSKAALLYIIIPIFLNSMWLTVEIIETMFLLLSFVYAENNGIFIGIASIFRPYSFLYTWLLNEKGRLRVFLICGAFALVLLGLGLFFPYLHELTAYGTRTAQYDEVDYVSLGFLLLFFKLGWHDKIMRKYAILSCVPLIIKLYGHYFLTPYSILFLAFLRTHKQS